MAPYCAIPRDYLSDTPLLRAMGLLVSQHGQLGAIPPPPFSQRFPLGEHAKWRCDTPPPQKGYLSDTGAIPYENRANGCDTPLCDTISKGYCAIWGGISNWAAKFEPLFCGSEKIKSRKIPVKFPAQKKENHRRASAGAQGEKYCGKCFYLQLERCCLHLSFSAYIPFRCSDTRTPTATKNSRQKHSNCKKKNSETPLYLQYLNQRTYHKVRTFPGAKKGGMKGEAEEGRSHGLREYTGLAPEGERRVCEK